MTDDKAEVRQVLCVPMPMTLQVGATVYDVELLAGLAADYGWLGRINEMEQRIMFDGSLPDKKVESQTKCILHEVLHAIDYAYLRDKLDEDVVDRLAEGLTQILTQFGLALVLQEDEA